MTDTNLIFSAENLTRSYGKKAALAGLTLTCDKPGIYGLLGRNGAGKSTFIRILTGQDLPTSGKALLFDTNPFDNPAALEGVCIALDRSEFGGVKNLREWMKVSASMYSDWDQSAADKLTARFELDPRKKLRAMSRGMQTAAMLLIALSSGAPLTIFDEPSLGLDAVVRERFYDMLLDFRNRQPKRTFLLSTHLIEEVSRTLDYVWMIEAGTLLAQGTVAELCGTAYQLSGIGAAVPQGARLLRREEINGITILTLSGERPTEAPAGCAVSSVSLQRLFVMLTDNHAEGSADK
ncbi:MAG: ABC transporter ATP-binding protein [Oscillospiraceae bacterium]|nr:ABC transporter ATP-binding protein [Oscillospiraceae bacterium]